MIKVLNHLGTEHLEFSSLALFEAWKEREEEITYSTYVKGQRSYFPSEKTGSIYPPKW
jgi:hypothetical protein